MQVGPSHALLQALAQVQQPQARAAVQPSSPAGSSSRQDPPVAASPQMSPGTPQRNSPLGRFLDIRV